MRFVAALALGTIIILRGRMQNTQHQNLVGFIWNIANKLRGPYRPPQYRR